MIPKIPTIHKPPKLKPLAMGDIMVALINQQHSVDHTAEYKRILGRFRNTSFDGEKEIEQQQLQLPQFATRELTQEQIFDYHIKNKIRDTFQYEKILQKVHKKIKISLIQYSDKLKQGENAIGELMVSLGDACQRLSGQRKYIHTCYERVNKSYSKIGPTLRKISNIQKVIEIMEVWGQSKLPYLFSIDVLHPHRYEITDVLSLFESAQSKINKNVQLSQSKSLQKILASLKQKHTTFIKNIYQQFVDAVIHYVKPEEYRTKYEQYLHIRDRQLLQSADVLTSQGIRILIQKNAKTMFFGVLVKLSPLMNVDQLNSSVYLDFFDEIIEQFVIYFRNWHCVTTFHLDNDTPYGNIFLESRKLAFLILSNCISNSIENSKKFISLEYKIKLQLVEKLEDYIEAGEKWMGNHENLELPKVVINKLSKQLQNIFGSYNNLIKNILTQQLSVSALESVDEPHPLTKVKLNNLISQINYEKISTFLTLHSSATTRIYSTNGSIQKQYNSLPDPPEVKLKIGTNFIEMIGEYFQRSKYLQSNKLIYITKMIEHFEFIFFMMYQVCIQDHIKQKLKTDLQARIQMLENEKNEELAKKSMNEIFKISSLKRSYNEILDFLKSIGNKYNGIRIAGIIDVNKVYQSQKLEIIHGYFKLVSRVVSDLIKILRWLIECIPHTQLKGYREVNRFNKFLDIIKALFKLVLENNMQNSNRKYTQMVGQMISKQWKIKSFNQETANQFKKYKMRLLQIFKVYTLVPIMKAQFPELVETVADKQVQTLYRSLLEIYGKIEKINDNGRQLIRLDTIDIAKMLNQLGVKTDIWSNWFDKYMDFTAERSYKNVLDKLAKIGVLYEPLCWKYQLMWITTEMVQRERKEYNLQLNKIYIDYFSTVA